MAIPLNFRVTTKTLAAYYPGLIPLKRDPAKYVTGRKRAGSALIPYSTLLHVEITAFHLPGLRQVLVSVALLPNSWQVRRNLAEIRCIFNIHKTGITRYVILWSPDFPPGIYHTGQPHSACLFLTASVANLSAKVFSSRGICVINIFSKPDKRCTDRLYKFKIPAFLTL